MTEERPFILDWYRLSEDQIEDRLSWLRTSLEAGKDWGYCPEALTCVLMTSDASVLYRMTWFTSDGEQEEVDKPRWFSSKGYIKMIENGEQDVRT